MAVNNIKRNKEIIIPYFIAIIITTISYFIILAMVYNEGLDGVPASATLRSSFRMGRGILTIFALIFLYYLSGFISKRRMKEFGLYNILGLEKRHIIYIVIIENIILYGLAVGTGIGLGALMSRFFFLLLLKFCNFVGTSTFVWSKEPFLSVCFLFLISFLICTGKNIWDIWRNNTIDLLKSEKYGDKKSKFTVLYAIIGLGLLIFAYYDANSIENNLEAITRFFPDVLLVIFATYLLFQSGVVTILRILKNRKSFYYKRNNFISIGSLLYRMKQNATGLANICILSTMILVTASGTISLYLGREDISKARNKDDIIYQDTKQTISKKQIEKLAEKYQITIENYYEYCSYELGGLIENSVFYEPDYGMSVQDYIDKFIMIQLVDIDSYNAISHTNTVLADDETIAIYAGSQSIGQTISIGENKLKVIDLNKNHFFINGKNGIDKDTLYLIVNSPKKAKKIVNDMVKSVGEEAEEAPILYNKILNYEGEQENKLTFAESIRDRATRKYYFHDITLDKLENYSIFGGLLFLGLVCIVIFLLIAVLIIYFKQITEGYEDRERFLIMQKVGMEGRLVKSAINKQVIIVFFFPLLLALCHILAATHIVQYMMMSFMLINVTLIYQCIIAVTLLFAVVYFFVYYFTSKIYYKIVKF